MKILDGRSVLRPVSVVALVAPALLAVGCASDDAENTNGSRAAVTADSAPDDADGNDEAAASDPDAVTIPETTLTPAVVEVTDEPGLADDDFVGARSDTTLDRCEAADGQFVAAGEVTNSSGTDASYRIYVSFNLPDSAQSRGLIQVDLEVADGATEPWEASAPLEEDDLECILRVERVAATT